MTIKTFNCIIKEKLTFFGVFMEKKAISSDLIRGHIDTIILYSLFDSDKYAQQISDSIEAKSNNEYKINQATLYSSLKRLETLKHVSSYWNEADDGRRKYFHLTEQGKTLVENNLSDWAYSKNIIDRLMDCETNVKAEEKVVYVVKEVEKQVEIDKPKNVETIENGFSKTQNSEPIVEEKTVLAQPVFTEKAQTNVNTTEKIEINFRSILNSLINYTPKKQVVANDKEKNEQELVELNAEDTVKGFNDTLTNSDYNEETTSFNGRIDFGDLKIKATNEGYKIRISSKDSAIPDGSLKINKLHFFSSLVLLFVMLAQFVPTYFVYKTQLSVSILEIVLFLLIIFSFPFYNLVCYFSSPNATKNKTIYGDSILNTAIVVFNLLLVNIAITFLANMDFSVTLNVIKYIYTPVMLMLDAIIFMISRFSFAKSKKFYKNK